MKRKLPDGIVIEIQERHPKYQLEYGAAYVYMDSQGYFLEISEEKLELPVIIGYSTSKEQIEEGNRLETEDLGKLDDILKISEAAKNNEMDQEITKIDITDKGEYKILFEAEGKTVHLEDTNDISERMLMIKLIIEKEKGNKGNIFLIKDKDFRFIPES